jgi:hypothetical protein
MKEGRYVSHDRNAGNTLDWGIEGYTLESQLLVEKMIDAEILNRNWTKERHPFAKRFRDYVLTLPDLIDTENATAVDKYYERREAEITLLNMFISNNKLDFSPSEIENAADIILKAGDWMDKETGNKAKFKVNKTK